MPVIAAGGRRFSARALSEELAGADGPLSRSELAALGIGELGRYLGGEVIKPLALGAGELLGGALPGRAGAAALFAASVELEKPPPQSSGGAFLHAQLEWLRGYGLSGGVLWPPERAEALAAYIRFLRETDGGRRLVFMDRAFFGDVLKRHLSEAAPFAAREEGIPVNWELGGAPVLSSAGGALGIVLYEDMPPAGKIKTDIALLIDSRSAREASPPLAELRAALKLGVIIGKVPARQDSRARKKADAERTALLGQSFLFRSGHFSLCRETPWLWRADGEALPGVPAARGSAAQTLLTADFRAHIGPEAAERLGMARQAGEGRVKTAARGIFAVNSKFSGLTPADFRDEQNCWYETGKGAEASLRGGTGQFAAFDRAGRAAFFRWRDYCRGGRYRSASSFAGAAEEAYLRVYVRELVLGMGREGRMETFQKLRELYHEFGAKNSSSAFSPRGFLLRAIVDFMIIYDLEKEALPLLAAEPDGVFDAEDPASSVSGEQLRALGDLIRCRLFVEEAWERPPAFAARFDLVASLVPARIRERSAQRPDFAENFCAALGEIDRQLRTRQDKSFFEFFFPPALSKIEVQAFADIPNAGRSSYTVFWPAFSAHRPLIDTLAALARDTGANPLSGGRMGRPVSLEAELIESLRRESDEVRDLLSVDDAKTKSARPRHGGENRAKPKQLAFSAYRKPDPSSMGAFMRSLDGDQRGVVMSLLDGNGPARESGFEMRVDEINTAFEARFGDLLVDTNAPDSESGYSISAEYKTILMSWKSPGG
jgi:hypothetical protein